MPVGLNPHLASNLVMGNSLAPDQVSHYPDRQPEDVRGAFQTTSRDSGEGTAATFAFLIGSIFADSQNASRIYVFLSQRATTFLDSLLRSV
jgi:hypothetical protein